MPNALASKILGPNGKPLLRGDALPQRRAIKSRYDLQETDDDNRRHWQQADILSARAANTAAVRLKLRTRARYEVANNSYALGIVLTLANDAIGTGPRLQVLTENNAENRTIETEFTRWADCVGLAEKLRTMRQAKATDGEAFALLATNPALMSPVQLDLRLIEADQISTPYVAILDPNAVDGIRFDVYGNPTEYHVLKYHPGDFASLGPLQFDRVPARFVLHWFRKDRPGQVRGIPDLLPALPLFAYLRRYTLATIGAAEIAASFAAMLQSGAPPDGETLDGDPFETLEIERGMMTTLPAGWNLAQLKAEQPTTTYGDFKHEILNEIARCLNMPFNIAAGNSSSYNYASGRLDHQTYYKSIKVEQSQVECAVLDRIFYAWLEEAYLVGLVSEPPDRLAGWPRQWFWDGHEHVDPLKEANAQSARLLNNTTTLADEWASRGQDWEQKLRQIAKEARLLEALGIPRPGAMSPGAPPYPLPVGVPPPSSAPDTEETDAED